MEINVRHGNILDADAGAVVVSLFEGIKKPDGSAKVVDQALGGAISELIKIGDLKGKLGEVVMVYPRGRIAADRVMIVGLGKPVDFGAEDARIAAASVVKRARELNLKEVATIVHGGNNGTMPLSLASQALVEGSLLALYEYDVLKVDDEKPDTLSSITLIENDAERIDELEKGKKLAEAIVSGVYLARDLVNMPPNVATPTKMSEVAREIADNHSMELVNGDRAWAAKREMGAYLAVAKGAGEEPKFIILEHNAGRADLDTIVLVGKGITFDTGGISIKSGERMAEMKSDMAGAATVLGTMQVVGLLNVPLRVIGIAPCTENMPDANAYRPADVITASDGKSIEVVNTDAEGRMILADALVYATKYQPDVVVDLATLTGSCVVALGRGIAAGLFSNDEKLRERLLSSGEATNERLWPLPLWDDYKEAIKSDVADIKNTGGRFGGVGTSAIFLKEFTSYPWAHLDIAGMALRKKEKGYNPKGASGFGVRLLSDFLLNW